MVEQYVRMLAAQHLVYSGDSLIICVYACVVHASIRVRSRPFVLFFLC